MRLFHFAFSGDDIECPNCKSKLYIIWDTDYGDPETGDHTGKCPKCNFDIDFECYTKYNVLKKED